MCDDFDIKTLPSNFVSVSRPSRVIEKLTEKRKKAHDDALEEMKARQQELNMEVDEEIEKESDIFVRKLGDIRDEVDAYINTVKFEHRKMIQQIIANGEDLMNKPSQKVSSSYEILLKLVDEFHEILVEIEKRRSDKLKSILNETNDRVISAAYCLPNQADEIFSVEILELNKIILNNYQNFAELKSELKLQVSLNMKFWTEELLEIREIQKYYYRELGKSRVERLRSTLRTDMAVACRSAEVMEAINKFESIQGDLTWPRDNQSGVPVSREQVEWWLKNVQKTLASLDQSARNLVSLYKSIIIILFNRFFAELAELKDSMTTSGLVDTKNIEDYQSEIYTPTVDELNLQYETDFDNLQNVWEENIDAMKDSIETTYQFLKGTASLWDKHFKRVIDLQTCVMLDLENTVEKNSQASMVHEAELNIQIEKLRQGCDEKKLEQFMADVQGTLNKIEGLYNFYSEREVQVVQKYKTMMEIEIDVLTAEIQRFLTMNPPYADKDPKIQRKRASWCSEKEIDPKELLVPNQILYCIFQVDATKNWMFGLWEAVNHYMSTCRAEILVGTERWMDRQREKIDERLKVKLAFHRPRYFRIKCSIHDKRLRELLLHTERFTSHKMAAEREIMTLKNRDEHSIEENVSAICNQFVLKTKNVLQQAERFKTTYQVHGCFHTLAPMYSSHKKQLKKLRDDYFEKCCTLLDTLRVSGYQYLKFSKLFSEEGSFSIEEITSLQKRITKLDEYAEKTQHKCMNDFETKFNKYLGLLESTYASTVSTLEELIREMGHNETVVKTIRKLRVDIRDEVLSLKTTMKKIDNDAKSLMGRATENIGTVDNAVAHIEQYREIIDRMGQFVEFMGQLESSQNAVASPVTSTISGRTSRLGALKIHADQETFFSINPLDRERNTFLARLNDILNDSFAKIKKQSKEFYAKHHALLLDHSRIQPNYDRSMEEVHHKYKNFQAQCEACWYENLQEFLQVLLEFQQLRDKYLRKTDDTFREGSIKKLEDANQNTMKELEDYKKRTQNDFQNMFKQLRALYGHPNNDGLLEQLQKDFGDLEQNYNNVDNILIPHTENLLNLHREEVENFEKMQETLTILKKDNVRLTNLIDELKFKLNDYSSHQSCHLLDAGSEMDIRNTARPSRTKSASSPMTPVSTINYYSPSESTDSAESVAADAGDFLEKLERTRDAGVRDADAFVDAHLKRYVEDRETIWASEINCIRDLFKVKYDDKNVL